MTASTESTAATWPSLEISEYPFPFYGALRDEAPVYKYPDRDEYVVSRWEDIVYVAEHPALFGQTGRPEPLNGFSPPDNLSHSDLPGHRDQRKLTVGLISRERMAGYESLVQEIADSLIDTFVDDGEAEFYAQFADPLPSLVICEILGLPREDLPFLRRIDEREGVGIRFLGSEQRAAHRALLDEQLEYMRRALLDKYQQPRNDFLSEFVQGQVARDGALDLDYLASEASLLLRAGNVTTTHMLASALMILLQHPEDARRVHGDQTLLGQLIEETLRMESPVQYVPRILKADAQIGGVDIPAGATVILVLASGNRDQERFSEPDDFSLERRDNVKHQLAFGRGIHLCLGAPLARLEGRVALGRLFSRLENIRLTPGKNDFKHVESLSFRAPKSVHIQFDRA